MKTFAIFLALFGLVAAKPFSAVENVPAPQCGAPNDNVCAQFVFANGTVSQEVMLNDNGCTEVAHSDTIAGIKVFDCWCGLWNAQSTTACNNGDDNVVDQINQCTGMVDGRKKGWKYKPTHVSCFRL